MSTIIQRSFSGGEISPSLYARVDSSKYQTGLRTCRNFIVQRQGGAANRAGTEFIGEVKDSTKAVRLIKFVFNNSQTYVLEFGDQYIRFIQDGVYLSDLSLTITGITNANPAVLSYTGTDPVNGDEFYVSGVVGPMSTFVNGRTFKVVNVNTGANTFELDYIDGTNVNSALFGSYTSGGTATRIYTISSPYLEADLPNLKYVQSADVLTIAHPTYAPRELARVAATNWSLSTLTFAPSLAAPASPAGTQNGSAGSTTYDYRITAVQTETYEESLPSVTATVSNGNATLTPTNNISLSWTAVGGAVEYNIYRSVNGVYSFIGVASTNAFVDTGFIPDTSDTPPIARNPFGSTNNYPSAVSYIQQRLSFANTNNDPEKVWMSKTGFFKNFTISSPIQDDDAVTFTMAGRQVNAVKHLLDIGSLVVFTTGGEWNVGGDQAGIIRPTDINPKQHSYNGSGDLAPIVIDGNALYVQARGSIVRDLGFDYQIDGYRGNDLTIFSSHLFQGIDLVDWDFQQVPNSTVWAVRDDGILLGLTYLREQQVLAWHRHDFNKAAIHTESFDIGEETVVVENVCCIPEGREDSLYLVVKRLINGRSVRYIERMTTRFVDDVKDCVFLDTSLSYDGRNAGVRTMALSGGTDYTHDETLTLTASSSFFTAADVGNIIELTLFQGDIEDEGTYRFTINAYTSGTVVTGKVNKTIIGEDSHTPPFVTAVWTRCVDQVSGLWHLEGNYVSVFADGFVVANPNNEAYERVQVEDGVITLDRPYGVIHVGLPYTSDLETLDIDTTNAETLVDKYKRVGFVTLQVEKSRGIWIGSSPPDDEMSDFLGGLTELKIRNNETYDDPIELKTEGVKVIIRPEWNSNGRVFVRQTDPLPLTILSIAPNGEFPIRGGG